MPTPRKQLISLDATPYYHCTSRCVRRAFLCGVDPHTQQSYEHRRQWVEDRILQLAEVFAIDVCAYAVMSNHLHVVLHINVSTAMHWSDQELCERWHKLYKGTALSQRFVRGEALDSVEMQTLQIKLDVWRLRLRDISWFMRTLNEPIARMANAEDQCTGSFWESRFRSQALLDEKALAACMAYVDLNPIRAKMADSPETSEHTSIKRRIAQLKETQEQPLNLAHFVGNPREPMPQGLPFHLKDYIELVEWSGRILREDKRGHISNQLPPILLRLGIPSETWRQLTKTFESQFSHFVGDPARLKTATAKLGFQRSPGLSRCKAAFS